MDGLVLGSAGIALTVLLLILRVPIGAALGGPAIVGILVFAGPNAAWGMLAQIPYEFSNGWTLSSIPMFILMGYVCYHSKITERLFHSAQVWLERLPGGLGVASVSGSAAFAAVTGSSLASAAAMGRIAAPEMIRLGYQPGFAAGTLAAAGTLGSLIPPSILLIVFGVFAKVSISQLFIGGVFPGLLSALLYSTVIVTRVLLTPKVAPQVKTRARWRERIDALVYSWPFVLLFVCVLGGLFAGFFTPTEAGAIGALLSFVIAGLKRALGWVVIRDAVVDTLHSTSSIFFIAIGASILTRFLSFTGVPTFMAHTVAELDLGLIGLMFAFMVLYIILGMFLDPLGCMLLTLPILLPILDAENANLIWFGVILVKLLEIGLITPPVGLNVFVLSSVLGDDVPVSTIFRGVAWFLITDILLVAVMIFYPNIILFLPQLIA
jgi:tripartite ATP-independent transporter DctM subunit